MAAQGIVQLWHPKLCKKGGSEFVWKLLIRDSETSGVQS